MSPPAGKGPARQAGPTDPAAAEIRAEIDDHLATAAEGLQARGLSAAQAQAKSQEQFGDAAAIGRRCYWIKQGDYFMFRTAVIVLLAMLCLALGFTTFSSWRAQRQMAGQMTALAEQLKSLAEQQKAVATMPLPPAEPKPLEITGRAFIGSPDKPAANINITIIDVKDGSHIRRIATDGDGNFSSGALGGGDYALLAEIGGRTPLERRYEHHVQSAPIGVYPGVALPRQQFDIAHHLAAVAIETSRPLPKLTIENRYTIDSRLLIKIYSSQDRSELWTTAVEPPLTWPVFPSSDRPPDRGGRRGFGERGGGGYEFFDLLSNEDLAKLGETAFGSTASRLPAGKIEVAAAVLADVYPVGYEAPEIPKRDRRTPLTTENRDEYQAAMAWQNLSISPAPVGLRRDGVGRDGAVGAMSYRPDDDRFNWMTKGLGRIWLTHLRGPADAAKPRLPYLISPSLLLHTKLVIEIASGETARLRITIPDDLEFRIRSLVDSTTDPVEFAKSPIGWKSSGGTLLAAPKAADPLESGNRNPLTSPFFRQAEIAVVSSNPFQPGETARGAVTP